MLKVCKVGLLQETREYKEDVLLRKKFNEILSVLSYDKDYADFLTFNLVNFYIKDKYPSLYEKLKK